MNKAITDGINFMPPLFKDGLTVWSSGDGTPGSDTYDGAVNAAFVPSDADFSGCLELQKTSPTQKLRHMGQTPLQPGCYLQIKARVKAISGNLPSVRIAAWAGGAGNNHVSGVTEVGLATTLTTYGEVVEITAIVGSGARGGVDMPWGRGALYGHFGLNLEGANGGIVRVDDIEIIDITSAFLRDLIGVVDVRDFGAVGDGTTDDSEAFEAADTAANGRTIYVPEGTYRLNQTVNLGSEVKFDGTVTMPTDQMLLLTKNFDLPNYIDAFGDEELAFRKAFQALMNSVDHETLDMGGRKIAVNGPIDMQAAVPNKTSISTRRVVCNGEFDVKGNAAWDTEVFTSVATYDPADSRKLKNVTNIANIPVGALITGNGVGREIYVRSKDVAAGELTMNAGLYDADGSQNFTFTEFKYLLDFRGFSKLTKFNMLDIEFQCNSQCSAICLPAIGATFSLSDCFISRPKDRGITSIGGGCQGLLIDQCQFLSAEEALDVAERTSIAINANANDVKLRNNRATMFKHFAVLGGDNSMVIGNHFFQGDHVSDGIRSAGLILIGDYNCGMVSSNYVDNCFIEWTNERDPQPDFDGGFSFSSMSITNNIFLAGDVAPWFSFIVIKPYGTGHWLNGVTVTGNKFRATSGYIERAERVDTSFADLNFTRSKNVTYTANMYHGVTKKVNNPLRVRHVQSTAAQTWTVDTNDELPFGANARSVEGLVAVDGIRTAGGSLRYTMPYVRHERGAEDNAIDVVWSEAVQGSVEVNIRIDKV